MSVGTSGRIGVNAKVKQNDITNENQQKKKKKKTSHQRKVNFKPALGSALFRKRKKKKKLNRHPGVDWWRKRTMRFFFSSSASTGYVCSSISSIIGIALIEIRCETPPGWKRYKEGLDSLPHSLFFFFFSFFFISLIPPSLNKQTLLF